MASQLETLQAFLGKSRTRGNYPFTIDEILSDMDGNIQMIEGKSTVKMPIQIQKMFKISSLVASRINDVDPSAVLNDVKKELDIKEYQDTQIVVQWNNKGICMNDNLGGFARQLDLLIKA